MIMFGTDSVNAPHAAITLQSFNGILPQTKAAWAPILAGGKVLNHAPIPSAIQIKGANPTV